jgi:hypothetical protein
LTYFGFGRVILGRLNFSRRKFFGTDFVNQGQLMGPVFFCGTADFAALRLPIDNLGNLIEHLFNFGR